MKEHYEKLNLDDAIYLGAQGIMRKGKMNSHQNRIGYEKCKIGAAELKLHKARLEKAKTFEEILQQPKNLLRQYLVLVT